MKKLYIAPDMEELRFQAMERLAVVAEGSEIVDYVADPEGEKPFG